MDREKTYNEFDRVTDALAAYLILDERAPCIARSIIGRVVIRHMARCSAYVQLWGAPMSIGRAGGGGYDRATAAIEQAVSRLLANRPDRAATLLEDNAWTPAAHEHADRWDAALMADRDNGRDWRNKLESAGYIVQHVLG